MGKVEYEGPNEDFRSKFHQSEGQAKKGNAENISVNHPHTKQDSEADRDNKYRLPHPEKPGGKLTGFDGPLPKGEDSAMQYAKHNYGTSREFDKKV